MNVLYTTTEVSTVQSIISDFEVLVGKIKK